LETTQEFVAGIKGSELCKAALRMPARIYARRKKIRNGDLDISHDTLDKARNALLLGELEKCRELPGESE